MGMTNETLVLDRDQDLLDHVRQAMSAARMGGHVVTVTLQSADKGEWLVEIGPARPWSILADAAEEALATFEKVTWRTLGSLVDKMTRVKKALADVRPR